MIDDQDHSSGATDVAIVSLGDRRRIRELEGQVDQLERRLAETLERVKPGLERLPRECYHHGRFLVAEDKMEVSCEQCGAQVDPYVVLRKIAHREVNFCYTLNALRDEAKNLRVEVDKLKRKRSSLRRARSADDGKAAT